MDTEGEKLDLAAQSRKPVPHPWKFCSSGADVPNALVSPLAPIQSSPVSQPAFDVSRHVGLVPVLERMKLMHIFLSLRE